MQIEIQLQAINPQYAVRLIFGSHNASFSDYLYIMKDKKGDGDDKLLAFVRDILEQAGLPRANLPTSVWRTYNKDQECISLSKASHKVIAIGAFLVHDEYYIPANKPAFITLDEQLRTMKWKQNCTSDDLQDFERAIAGVEAAQESAAEKRCKINEGKVRPFLRGAYQAALGDYTTQFNERFKLFYNDECSQSQRSGAIAKLNLAYREYMADSHKESFYQEVIRIQHQVQQSHEKDSLLGGIGMTSSGLVKAIDSILAACVENNDITQAELDGYRTQLITQQPRQQEPAARARGDQLAPYRL